MNVHESLMAQLQARATFGQQKYGKALEPWNGRNPVIDAQEELLDLFVYLEQLRMEREMVVEELRKLDYTITGLNTFLRGHSDEWWASISNNEIGNAVNDAEDIIQPLLKRLSQDVTRIGYPAKEEEQP